MLVQVPFTTHLVWGDRGIEPRTFRLQDGRSSHWATVTVKQRLRFIHAYVTQAELTFVRNRIQEEEL